MGFELLYERYSGVLLSFVYRFTGNQQQAEEILHEVFTEALRAPGDSPDFNWKAWLFTVAKHKSQNFERRKRREVLSDESVRNAPDPRSLEDEFATAQILQRLHVLQAKLPVDLAQTWSLRQQGMDYKEIAAELKIPLGTVKSRFHRLAEFLRKELGVGN